jgi:hypothetical protein
MIILRFEPEKIKPSSQDFHGKLPTTVFPRIIAVAIWWLLTDSLFSLSYLYTILSYLLCLPVEIQMAAAIVRGKTVASNKIRLFEVNF